MAFDFDLGKDFLDFLIGADQKSGALNSHEGTAHKRLLLVDAVFLGRRFIFIRKERKRKLVFGGEFCVGRRRIKAHPLNFGAFGLKFFSEAAEFAGFFGAARRIILGIKIKNGRCSF